MTKGNLNNLDKSFVQNLSNNWALVTSGRIKINKTGLFHRKPMPPQFTVIIL